MNKLQYALSGRIFKPKRCKVCSTVYQPHSMSQICCSPPCGIAYAQAQRVKKTKKEEAADRKATKEKRERLKTRSDHLKDLQRDFNRFIVQRDAARPCISCGRHHEGRYHAGHFYSVGSRPELRFDEDNVHKQCAVCNLFLHGNLLEYRRALREHIGVERLDALECARPPLKLSTEEIRELAATYRAKTRELKKQL